MTRELVVVIEGRIAGTLVQATTGALSFFYDGQYLGLPDPTPLSLSLPLATTTYKARVVRPFLEGLLPDSADIREAWARQYQVSERNPFALLEHIGNQCAGAVQFVPPDRVGSLHEGGHRKLTTAEITRWIRELAEDPGAPLPDLDGGQFSLAGAKAKFGLLKLEDGSWALPHGAIPTTHVIKPASGRLTGQELNENVCLELARAVELLAARTEYLRFGRQEALVSTRYDRRPVSPGVWERVHQEDLCQALAVEPGKKYQRRDGGPGVRRISEELRLGLPSSAADRALSGLAEGLMFNWLVGGTDAHAKNYSLLLAGSEVAFAPLYDVASWLPYRLKGPQLTRRPGHGDHSQFVMAMSINGKYEGLRLTVADWVACAQQMQLDPDWLVGRGRDLTEALKAVLHPTVARVRKQVGRNLSASHEGFLSTLESCLESHLNVCTGILQGRPAHP